MADASSPAAIASRAAAALVIRRAAEPLLLHGVVDGDAWTRAAAADAAAWHLFLRVERCALPLRRALTRARVAAPANAPFHAVLGQFAQREAARVLVACTHLRTTARIAAARGIAVLVLKGGALAPASDQAIDLNDVDVLVPRHAFGEVIAGLRDAGSVQTDSTSERVGQSLVSHGVTIEVHETLGEDSPTPDDEGVWDRSEPIEAMPPLRRLGAADNLHHVVHHVAVAHLNRRLRLRDLLLIAHAARRCTPSEVAAAFTQPSGIGRPDATAAVDEAGAGHAMRISRATLDSVVRPPNGQLDRDHERRILTNYVLNCRRRLTFLPWDVDEFVEYWSVSMLQGPWEQRQIWAGARAHALGHSTRPYIRAIEQRSARLGRLWRVTARTAYRAATWIVARPVVARTRRTVDQALRGLQREEAASPPRTESAHVRD